MSQLTLDLLPEVAPTLDNFIVGANSECLQQLRALRDGQRTHRFIYLWGLPGCGRSHLARALASATAQIAEADPVFPDVPADDTVPGASSLLVVDDEHLLGPDEQIALFRQFIAAAARPQRAQLLQAFAVGSDNEVVERGRHLGQQIEGELAHCSRA